MLYVCGKQSKLCSFLFKCFVILYDGACVLFITGLIGLLSLCVFMYTLRKFGAIGILIAEQQVSESNPLYELINATKILPRNLLPVSRNEAHNAHP